MGLLSGTTIALAGVLALAAPAASLVLWNRLGPHRAVRITVRAVLLLAAQGFAVLFAALLLNKTYDFYTSWPEVFGHPTLTTAASSGRVPRMDRLYEQRLGAAYRAGHGTVLPLAIPGSASGLPPQPALVYLPAAYGNPAARAVTYPVVELLDGLPGNPGSWTGPLQLQSTLDSEIASMQSLPFIAVMPTTNVLSPRDTECVNVVGGPQVDTYLTRDVRAAVLDSVRAETGSRGWGVVGYSSGGYCAVNLAMRHPNLFSAAVSMSGYARPALNRATGPLFGGSRRLRDQNTPLWEARHWRRGGLAILAISSRHDGPSYRDTVALGAAARGQLRITDVLLARGGHNAKLWTAMEPVTFNWLSLRLAPPLAGVTIRSGLEPTTPPPAVRQASRRPHRPSRTGAPVAHHPIAQRTTTVRR
jgi:enterochelin esterase-like enzyme